MSKFIGLWNIYVWFISALLCTLFQPHRVFKGFRRKAINAGISVNYISSQTLLFTSENLASLYHLYSRKLTDCRKKLIQSRIFLSYFLTYISKDIISCYLLRNEKIHITAHCLWLSLAMQIFVLLKGWYEASICI